MRGRLRLLYVSRLCFCVQDAAAMHAAQERSEAQADAWKAEARVLRGRLQASEKVGPVGRGIVCGSLR